MEFYTGGNERNILGNGKIGIGTTIHHKLLILQDLIVLVLHDLLILLQVFLMIIIPSL